MRITILLVLFFILISNSQKSIAYLRTSVIFEDVQAHNEFFDESDAFLRANVLDGKVSYGVITNNPTKLNALLSEAAILSPHYNLQVEKAYWINLYNLLAIKSVVDLYPNIESPLKVDGFFNKRTFKIRGENLTLDDIEKKKLLPVFNDSRLHFVLVCAANGCPKLKSGAYVPEQLDQQIEKQTTIVLNDPTFIKVKASEKSIKLSELLKWYQNDFTGGKFGIIEYVNKFRDQKIPPDYKVGYYTYDWGLNSR